MKWWSKNLVSFSVGYILHREQNCQIHRFSARYNQPIGGSNMTPLKKVNRETRTMLRSTPRGWFFQCAQI